MYNKIHNIHTYLRAMLAINYVLYIRIPTYNYTYVATYISSSYVHVLQLTIGLLYTHN